MMAIETNTVLPKKICRECGCEIIEVVESALYECERCIGTHEE